MPANYQSFHMLAHHPPSPSITDSSECPEYTPVSSPRGSSSGPGLPQYRPSSRHSSSSSRTARRTKSSGRRIKEEQKRKHERKARADQSAVLRDMEDLYNILFAWSCNKAQSTGNGHTSGLVGDKLANSQVAVALIAHFGQQAIRQGLENGNLPQVQAEIRAVCDRAVNHPRGPLAGSWLDTGLDGDECITNKKGDKTCHNPNHTIQFADARDCRKTRRTATFHTRVSDEWKGNKQVLQAQLEPALTIVGPKFGEVRKFLGQMSETIERSIPRKR
ncbi:hypothetical protein Tdes44962_MAKER05044 [Teratosphaeria destructans]|uniref:Uncharacterized protein n=1 Tax=Teratosphaeria destructans TaxID=418781 RepID=A0A9W7SL32_9PEZI|nr:hypothetical protein Tdes44962_MAKER05044 [Teratosphaeria destructans]